jgi:Spy/CpxP family protein refolding chaperone
LLPAGQRALNAVIKARVLALACLFLTVAAAAKNPPPLRGKTLPHVEIFYWGNRWNNGWAKETATRTETAVTGVR